MYLQGKGNSPEVKERYEVFKMKIKTTCPICKKVNYVSVDEIGFMRWQEEGILIQNALPELNAGEREMLKTGICPTCWDKMFSFPEDDEEEDFEEPEDDDLANEMDDMVEEDIDAFLSWLNGQFEQ